MISNITSRIFSIENYKQLLLDNNFLQQVRDCLLSGNVVIAKNVLPLEYCDNIIQFLGRVGQNSFPSYHPVVYGSPNHHRIIDSDPRSYVKGKFHQYSFFPWNQDHFSLFEKTKHIFQIKNLLSNLDKDLFTETDENSLFTKRLSFQHYPTGGGFLNKHVDPVDEHQLVVPLLTLSNKGVDYNTGGLFVENGGEKLDVDKHTRIGDVTFFNAKFAHGVEEIDCMNKADWCPKNGRWMMIYAINAMANKSRGNIKSIDLEKDENI